MARHGPLVRYRADPGRSRLQLLPLPGICLAIVAVVVSTHATRTCVSRRPDCFQPHSHSSSHRETQPHAHAWRPTSPVYTATSHTRSLSHTVGHSHTVPHTHIPRHSHPRGHSPAVSHPHRGVRTHVPPCGTCGTALTSSTSRGTTELTWSRPASRGILPHHVPEGGYPAARTGSQHARRAQPHCPLLPLCVCVRVRLLTRHHRVEMRAATHAYRECEASCARDLVCGSNHECECIPVRE